MGREKFIVYTGIGDLLIFWIGSAEHDELMRTNEGMTIGSHILPVSELLTCFVQVLKQVCKGISEATLLESYAKVNLVLDTMLFRGLVDQMDPFYVKNYMGMKFEEVKKK